MFLAYYPVIQYVSSIDSYSVEFLTGFQFKHNPHTAALLNGDFIFSQLLVSFWLAGGSWPGHVFFPSNS